MSIKSVSFKIRVWEVGDCSPAPPPWVLSVGGVRLGAHVLGSRVKMECDGTRAETRFGLPAKRTSPLISAGVSVQSAAGSRGVRISGSNAG